MEELFQSQGKFSTLHSIFIPHPPDPQPDHDLKREVLKVFSGLR